MAIYRFTLENVKVLYNIGYYSSIADDEKSKINFT